MLLRATDKGGSPGSALVFLRVLSLVWAQVSISIRRKSTVRVLGGESTGLQPSAPA